MIHVKVDVLRVVVAVAVVLVASVLVWIVRSWGWRRAWKLRCSWLEPEASTVGDVAAAAAARRRNWLRILGCVCLFGVFWGV